MNSCNIILCNQKVSQIIRKLNYSKHFKTKRYVAYLFWFASSCLLQHCFKTWPRFFTSNLDLLPESQLSLMRPRPTLKWDQTGTHKRLAEKLVSLPNKSRAPIGEQLVQIPHSDWLIQPFRSITCHFPFIFLKSDPPGLPKIFGWQNGEKLWGNWGNWLGGLYAPLFPWENPLLPRSFVGIFFRLIVKQIDREELTWSLFPNVPLFPYNFDHYKFSSLLYPIEVFWRSPQFALSTFFL